jgi:tRNA(Arg) A34 adenosine deaminase TadA
MSGTERNRYPQLLIDLPDWVESSLPEPDRRFHTIEQRMELVVELARRNVVNRSGGPFAAAVFDADTGRLIAPGVNVVVQARWSGGHAEILALAMAQRLLQNHDLGAAGLPICELVTSCEPCGMCLGATVWSGVRRIVCGARDADVRSIGFDEGPKFPNWADELERRGVHVKLDVGRDAATRVLQNYLAAGGVIYNPRTGDE